MDLWSLGKEPVNPDNPTGSDVKSDTEFGELSDEIKKLSSPSGAGDFSWQKVSDLSSSILSGKSKHIMVASYLAVAQAHMNKIEGLGLGTRIISDLLEQFWDNLFPPKKRKKGRVQAVMWWLEKTEAAFQNIEPSPVPFERMEQIKHDLKKIDDLLGEYLDDPPLLRPIQRVVESFPVEEPPAEQAEDEKTVPDAEEEKTLPEEQPRETKSQETKHEDPPAEVKPAEVKPTEVKNDKPPETKPPETKPEAKPPEVKQQEAKPPEIKETKPVTKPVLDVPPPEVKDIESEKAAQSVLRTGLQTIRKAGTYLREINPASSQAYRYARIASWPLVEVLPQLKAGKDGEKGITQVPGPPAATRKALSDLKINSNWENLLKMAEQNLSRFIFWLDLNYYVAEACENLGNEFQKAGETVCQETAMFVHRLPGLETLSYSDGTPFADIDTQEWLSSIGLGKSAPESGNTAKVLHNDDWMAERFRKAQALAKANKLVEAVETLQEEWKSNFSRRESLLWRLALSQLLVNSRQANLALPHLEMILQDIDNYGLEEWDPDLSLKSLKVVWTGFTTLSDESSQKKAAETLHRITKLNPAEALRLGKQ
ncbi:MAG: type VI secretion system protein TssA [Desulfobacterales bacterium]|nr:type VI secretion system protein TssA [Desulfobacterales bacterium]